MINLLSHSGEPGRVHDHRSDPAMDRLNCGCNGRSGKKGGGLCLSSLTERVDLFIINHLHEVLARPALKPRRKVEKLTLFRRQNST